MTLNRLIELGIKNDLCISEVLLLYLLVIKDYRPESLLARYINKFGTFPEKMLKKLERLKFIENFNSVGQYLPEMYMLKEKGLKLFTDESMGDEFWEAYPTVFTMRDKGVNFIARAGGDKDYITSEYLRRIGYSREKHEEILKLVKKYESLVSRGLINGYKIIDFVKSEIWDVIATIEDNDNVTFGKDL